MKHTQGQWKVHSRILFAVTDQFENDVAVCVTSAVRHDQQANAKRIVDCVNAFAGIDDPAEYMAGVKLLEKEYHAMKERWGLAAVQNRHLVEALCQIKELLTGEPSEENAAEAMLVADAAIQKAKGSKP